MDDYCYECTGYGDDYYYDEELNDYVCACDDCPHNDNNWEDGWWRDDIQRGDVNGVYRPIRIKELTEKYKTMKNEAE